MKVLKTILGFALALAITICMSACTDPMQKKIDKAHKETEAAQRAAAQAQQSYDQLIRDYERYKQTQSKLG